MVVENNFIRIVDSHDEVIGSNFKMKKQNGNLFNQIQIFLSNKYFLN